jgi:branched-chain amino acid transport system permease protein
MNNDAIRQLVGRRSLKAAEFAPWVLLNATFLLLPDYLLLGRQIIIMTIFAISLDIILGYAGIITLGHAAFYGVGAYTAGLLAVHGWHEPISGLLISGGVSALAALIFGLAIFKTSEVATVMLTMVIALLGLELANRFQGITGGFDGLEGITIAPLFGTFDFDFFGKTAFLYCLGVLFLVWVVARFLVNAPFGRSLVGIQENPTRMEALGVSVYKRRVVAFAISGAVAGLAGALTTQTNQFVSLDVFSFALSGTVLVMLVFGGVGRLYGAFIGVPIYVIAQNIFATIDPVYWLFWMGILLVIVVLFFPSGIIGISDRLRSRLGKSRARQTE